MSDDPPICFRFKCNLTMDFVIIKQKSKTLSYLSLKKRMKTNMLRSFVYIITY